MRNRVIIENVRPELENGHYFIKRIQGERVNIQADIFSDGHDVIRASLYFRLSGKKNWEESFLVPLGNDSWAASFTPTETGFYEYKLEAWMDHLQTWLEGFHKKQADGQHMAVELEIGANLLTKTAGLYSKTKSAPLLSAETILRDKKKYQEAVNLVLSPEFAKLVYNFPLKQFQTVYDNNLKVRVGRKKELFSSWYEFFPRSASRKPGTHGTFKDCEELLPKVAEMGFDVLYFPPIHPIGEVNRKGKNNSVTAKEGEPGSPWAIGSKAGGHKAIHKELGTLADYKKLIKSAQKLGIEIALDLAFQCAPDHPYIKEHPDWFVWRPDGTIAYAENPPKKYQDIVPLDFETADWENLWNELKEVILYWVKQGVNIFRVDNPHTKPLPFWEWVIGEVQKQHPDVIFLAEAFTRPKVMAGLAKAGFTQGYSYFTWRTNKAEMEEYLTEISKSELREFFRPNFWPNTPDILPYELMGASSNAFVKRLFLAATMSSNYGLYGPAYELLDNQGNFTGKEEYLNSEKFEFKHYPWEQKNRLTDAITRINQIRKTNPALQDTYNIHFTRTDNDQLMSYVKLTEDRSNIIWCIANFDSLGPQAGFVEVPKELLGMAGKRVQLQVTDLLTGASYHWFNDWNYVELHPGKWPMHIFQVTIG
ncbi:MAG: alpha-1,4-glucan--maltose-1-phosphate maltosyltransferase [Saprospiraceae bacterium]|nr:alpha-1,4-glucan--maltose-1-phosphate maltosyltransferase [Saprospiraceae bacterium]